MRKLTQLVLLASLLAAGPAFADMKIAVLNYQMALLESDAAKRYAVDAEKKFGPQLTKLKNLESSAKGIQDRLVSGGDKMRLMARVGVGVADGRQTRLSCSRTARWQRRRGHTSSSSTLAAFTRRCGVRVCSFWWWTVLT